MRIFIDSLVAVMLAGILAAIITHYRSEQTVAERADVARDAVRQLSREVLLQAALGQAACSETGYPLSIDPEWFGRNVPDNPLVGPAHPWLEIADESQRHLEDPHERIASDRSLAMFWYNPWTGKVRARMPAGLTDDQVKRLYEQVNGTPSILVAAGAKTSSRSR